MTSDGAERREIAGRRPLGDARPIREADVWANMGRNLSRQPKAVSALAFLEQAREVRRGATRAMQAGLQPAEQQHATGLPATKLAQTLQRRRMVACVAQTAEQLTIWTRAQGVALQGLAQLAPAVRSAVMQAMTALRPVVQQAVAQISRRPERVRRREQAAELEAGRERLLAAHMHGWWRQTQYGWRAPSSAQEAQWKDQAKVEEASQRAAIATMPESKLRQAVWQEEADREQEQQRERQAARVRGSSPGMGK